MRSIEPNVPQSTFSKSEHDTSPKPAAQSSTYSILIAAVAGGAFSAILPAVVIIWRIDACGYGINHDYSSVFVCLPPFVITGAVAGAFIGGICRWLARLVQTKSDIAHLPLISSIIAGILAVVVGLSISLIPAFMFAFPDC